MSQFTKDEASLTKVDTMSVSDYVRVIAGGSSRSISLNNLATLINALAGSTFAVITSTTNYVATNATDILLMDLTAGDLSATLPAATISEGKVIQIKKVDSSTNDITVQTEGGDIDGSTTVTMSGSGGAMPGASFVSDGTNWFILNA